MIEIKISKQAVEKARNRHINEGDPYEGASIEGGKGRFYSFLAEEILVENLLGSVSSPTKNYDVLFGTLKLEVKAKTRKDTPRPNYDATVDKNSEHQRPDFYVFFSILAPQYLSDKEEQFILNYPYETAYLLGYIRRDEFYRKAVSFNQGDRDPSNGLWYRENINLVKISELTPIENIYKEVGAPNVEPSPSILMVNQINLIPPTQAAVLSISDQWAKGAG